MPSIARSKQWFCRITLPHSIITEKISKLSEWIDLVNVLCLLHTGDKTEKEHCHFTITLTSELQKQAFDKRVRLIFDVKGADYSSKPWDGESSANSYMFHDPTFSIVLNKGYTSDDITSFITANAQVQKIVAINQSRGPGKIVQSVVQQLQGTLPDKIQIGTILLEKIRDGEMYEPGNYKLAQLIEEIYLKLVPKDQWDAYCQNRISQLRI